MAKETISFAVGFSFEKETPGTYRFQESGEKESHKIGTLYVKKSVFPNGPPKSLVVKVEVVK
jgi:hypothetical protein